MPVSPVLLCVEEVRQVGLRGSLLGLSNQNGYKFSDRLSQSNKVEKNKRRYSKLASGLHTCIHRKPQLLTYNFGGLEVLD